MANITFSEASGVNDSIFGKSQAPIRLFIEKRGEAFEQQSVVKHLFAQEKSNHFGEKFTSLTAICSTTTKRTVSPVRKGASCRSVGKAPN